MTYLSTYHFNDTFNRVYFAKPSFLYCCYRTDKLLSNTFELTQQTHADSKQKINFLSTLTKTIWFKDTKILQQLHCFVAGLQIQFSHNDGCYVTWVFCKNVSIICIGEQTKDSSLFTFENYIRFVP